MIVNMYVDHLMSPSPASAEEVWNATRVHAKLFSDAAARIGLTPGEYREFRTNLLDGKAVYLRLPRRVDAMSGDRRGAVYAVKNAVMNVPIMGWRVNLADGNVVYVPQICGNISLLRHTAVAQAPAPPPMRRVLGTHAERVAYSRKPVRYVKADRIEPETPVIVTPDAPAQAATVAQVVPSASASLGGSPFLFFVPAALGGIIAGTVHSGSTNVPPCTQGSNAAFACRK